MMGFCVHNKQDDEVIVDNIAVISDFQVMICFKSSRISSVTICQQSFLPTFHSNQWGMFQLLYFF